MVLEFEHHPVFRTDRRKLNVFLFSGGRMGKQLVIWLLPT